MLTDNYDNKMINTLYDVDFVNLHKKLVKEKKFHQFNNDNYKDVNKWLHLQ